MPTARVTPDVESIFRRRGLQLLGAALMDPALVDEQDLVRLADGGQPVRDHPGSAARQRGLERALDRHLGFGVQVRGGLVEHDDLGRLEQQPGQRHALLLPAGEPVAAVAGRGVQARPPA
jgi:hypothetical protein